MPTPYELAEQIKTHLHGFQPNIAIILGSGLGGLADKIKNPIIVNYADILGFPQSTVAGHSGRLICGQLGGKNVLCMQGRFHMYEGHPISLIADIIHAYKLLGIEKLIVTNAAGSLRHEIAPGSLMLISDHINFSCQNPLIGPNDESFGPRFPAMDNAYDKDLRLKAHQLAQKLNIELNDGVYMFLLGPTFETPAEIKMQQVLGADAVGMSTVPEVISAVHCGIKVLGISVITNYGCGLQAQAPSHAETLANANLASDNLQTLVKAVLEEI